MDKLSELLRYIQKTNPSMDRKRLIEELSINRYSSIALVMIAENVRQEKWNFLSFSIAKNFDIPLGMPVYIQKSKLNFIKISSRFQADFTILQHFSVFFDIPLYMDFPHEKPK